MGDNGFSNFKKPDQSWFRLFCEDTFKQVFGKEETHQHQWLRPDNGVVECATCGATRNHYGANSATADALRRRHVGARHIQPPSLQSEKIAKSDA